MKKSRLPSDPDSPQAAYFRGLRWLTARELSEAQIRDRLEERGYSQAAIAAAIKRLKDEGTLDDARAAASVARTEANVRRHGPRRVLGRLSAMRIEDDLARQVVREQFGDSADEAERIDASLERRLRGKREKLNDPAERRKLIAYLVRQGFSVSAASLAVRRKSREESQ